MAVMMLHSPHRFNQGIGQIILPNGQAIAVELVSDLADMRQGMMHRESLPTGYGMLFIHQAPGFYPYWMHNVCVPLDMIWISEGLRIVEIVSNAEPCSHVDECPRYGGNKLAQYVLELTGGEARRFGLRVGDILQW